MSNIILIHGREIKKDANNEKNFHHHFCVRDINNDIIIRTGVVSTKSTMSYNKRNIFLSLSDGIKRHHKKTNKKRPQKEWRSYIVYAWNLKFNKVENGKREKIKFFIA